MYTGIKHFHSYWAYIVLILLIVTVISCFAGKSKGREFSTKDRKFALFTMIAAHIQFLLGVFLLFLSPYWEALTKSGMGEVMKNSLTRMMLVEHPLTNVIAITLITIGWSRHKKQETSKGKFNSIALFYLIGLLLLLSRIPFSAWWS